MRRNQFSKPRRAKKKQQTACTYGLTPSWLPRPRMLSGQPRNSPGHSSRAWATPLHSPHCHETAGLRPVGALH